MPALPNVAKVVRLDLFFVQGAATRIRDRIYLSFTGPGPGPADLATLTTTISNAWATNMSQDQVAAISLTGIQLTDLTSQSGAQLITSVARPGTNIGTAGNAGLAAIVKFRINRRYRGGHPRFYMPGPPNTQLTTSQTWSAAYIAGVATHFASFVAASVLAPPANFGILAQVNVSYFLGFTNRTFPSGRTRPVPTLRVTPLQDVVVSYSGNPIVAQQRRRNGQSP